MQTKQYSSSWGVSQSAIKDFRFKSPKRWKEVWIDKQLDLDKNEDAFTFGSLVDTILFTPDLIEERFYIADVSKLPSDSIEKIIKYVYDTTEVKLQAVQVDDDMLPEPTIIHVWRLDQAKDKILEACNKFEWNSTWKDDTRINKVIEKGNDYYKLLADARGRKIITSEMNLEAITVAKKLRTDERVSKYFVDGDNHRNIFQLEIFQEYNSDNHFKVPLKCAIDILHIDEDTRTIQVCDFKTSHSAHNFIQSIKQFGYCDQLSFYTNMLKMALATDEFREQLGLNLDYDYYVQVPINIVIDETEKIPYIYEYDWKDIEIAKDGNSSYLFNVFQTQDHNARIKKGWKQILEEICWHLQNNKWEYPVELYETGKIKVNLING